MRRAVAIVHRVCGGALVRTAVQTGEARHLETEAAQLRRDVAGPVGQRKRRRERT